MHRYSSAEWRSFWCLRVRKTSDAFLELLAWRWKGHFVVVSRYHGSVGAHMFEYTLAFKAFAFPWQCILFQPLTP